MNSSGVREAVAIGTVAGRRRRFEGLLRFIRRKPLGAAGAFIVIILVLVAIFADQVAPYDPVKMSYSNRFHSPSAQFFLGTDNFGRDVFSRIVFGARVSLWISMLSVLIGTTGGSVLGLISGFLGGRFDFIVQRFVDTLQAFPMLILALTIMAALGVSLTNVIVAISIVLIPTAARVVRSSALAVRETEYVQASRAIGCSTWRITFLHVLPNCTAPYIIVATAAMGSAIIVEASLSFLGLGVPPPHPSWGSMLSFEGREYIEKAPWVGIFPGVAISLVVYGFNLLGDALRDVWDPRLRAR